LTMIASDFRRIALSLEGAEEGSHMGQPDFRVGGRIFATLASEKHGFGNLMFTPEQQALFVAEQPSVFLPVPGGWGKNGVTHIRLADANEDVLWGALLTAWKLRIEKNERARMRPASSTKRRSATPAEVEAAKRRKTELRARLISPAALAGVKARYGLED
jgi:YjbR